MNPVYVVQDADVPWWLIIAVWVIYGAVVWPKKVKSKKIKNK